jgi:hypothetical protein
MTKEEILSPHDLYAWECDEGDHVVPYSAAEKAMDEYAKQQAIALVAWSIKNNHYVGVNGEWYSKDGEGVAATTGALYDQFIEQQNKP